MKLLLGESGYKLVLKSQKYIHTILLQINFDIKFVWLYPRELAATIRTQELVHLDQAKLMLGGSRLTEYVARRYTLIFLTRRSEVLTRGYLGTVIK